ncbi:DUF4062 domain-containing protein [Paenibacillus polymyxa]|uniref:DUF4062 domain-containing protein n=1 Tax=Paenibacillus polymyxa TaxID=1406 RepID=UPI002023D74B|nr:DUF4062 domain-containing protein [Paenibacillus polymyxa]URJ45162.1 DUF4062 domain-containing protein [Paenibacillus polymyxa]
MEKRYQVFVSSTYQDLQEERKEIMQALLELDCIPSGMELFPATNDDQWTLIKNVIDDSDYYIVVLGGRYGSIGPQGISYTEMEYRYALEKEKPIIAFIHKNPQELPSNRTEQEREGREKLEAFKSLTQEKLVRYWTTPSDLGSVVSRSLIKLIKSNPAVGWVRADKVLSEETSQEMLKMRKRIDELEKELEQANSRSPQGTEHLAQGEDLFEVSFWVITRKSYHDDEKLHEGSVKMTWNDILYQIGPQLIDLSSEETIKASLDDYILTTQFSELKELDEFRNTEIVRLEVDGDSFQTIKIQLKALGLIEKSLRNRSVKDSNTYWTLTTYGDLILTKLRAVTK